MIICYLEHLSDLGVSGQGHIYLKSVENCLTTRNARSSFNFRPKMFVLRTMIAYKVKMAIGYSNH